MITHVVLYATCDLCYASHVQGRQKVKKSGVASIAFQTLYMYSKIDIIEKA